MKTATVMAAIVAICLLPFLGQMQCYSDEGCEAKISYAVSALLLCGVLLSLLLNPKPLVDEEKN